MSNGINLFRTQPLAVNSSYPRLEVSLEADVVILGTGIAAFCAAIQLIKSGRRVTVVAPGAILDNATTMPEGYHAIAEPTAPAWWYETLGPREACSVAAAFRESILTLETLAARIPQCRFELTPAFFVARSGEELLAIERECATGKALRNECWFSHAVALPFSCAGTTRLDHLCNLNVGAFVRALATEFVMLGGRIFEDSPCIDPPHFDSKTKIKTERGQITADSVLLATRIPSSPLSVLLADMTPVHSYFLAIQVNQPLDEGIFVVNERPRRVIWRANRYEPTKIIIRTEYEGEEPVRQNLRFEELACYAASHFSVARVEARWSTHHLRSRSKLPVVAKLSKENSVFALAGLGFLEIPWGVACGEAAAALMLGDSTPFSELLGALDRQIGDDASIKSQHGLLHRNSGASRRKGSDQQKSDRIRSNAERAGRFPEYKLSANSQHAHAFHRYQANNSWRTRSC